jgi:hypothetical protein
MSTVLGTKHRWVPLLLAGLLLAATVLPAGSESQAGAVPEPRATTGKIMVPASAFIPTSDNWDYDNTGWSLGMVSGNGGFTAPLSFPMPEVTIKKVILIAYDNSGGSVCMHLIRTRPFIVGEKAMTPEMCTTNSTDTPQKVITTAISPSKVNTVNQGTHLLVYLSPGTSLYGAQVVYRY